MKNYVEPSVEIVELEYDDIIVTSGEGCCTTTSETPEF